MEIEPPKETEFADKSGENAPEAIIDRIQLIAEKAAEAEQPLELPPHRDDLFAAFATAYAAGHTAEEGPLCADELTRALGQRWGLDQSAQQSVASQQKLNEADLARMRLLWSTLRLWMEWGYAWSRWAEFNSVDPKRPR